MTSLRINITITKRFSFVSTYTIHNYKIIIKNKFYFIDFDVNIKFQFDVCTSE